jgi:hypothetical protein
MRTKAAPRRSPPKSRRAARARRLPVCGASGASGAQVASSPPQGGPRGKEVATAVVARSMASRELPHCRPRQASQPTQTITQTSPFACTAALLTCSPAAAPRRTHTSSCTGCMVDAPPLRLEGCKQPEFPHHLHYSTCSPPSDTTTCRRTGSDQQVRQRCLFCAMLANPEYLPRQA